MGDNLDNTMITLTEVAQYFKLKRYEVTELQDIGLEAAVIYSKDRTTIIARYYYKRNLEPVFHKILLKKVGI